MPRLNAFGSSLPFGSMLRNFTTVSLRDRALLPRSHQIALHQLRIRRRECQALSSQLSSSSIPEIDGGVLDRWKRVLDTDSPIRPPGYFSASDEEVGGIGGEEEDGRNERMGTLAGRSNGVKQDRTWGLANSEGLYNPDRTRKFLISELETCISALKVEEDRVWEEGVRVKFGSEGEDGEDALVRSLDKRVEDRVVEMKDAVISVADSVGKTRVRYEASLAVASSTIVNRK